MTPRSVVIECPSSILKPSFYCLPVVHHEFLTIAFTVSSSACYTTDASVSGIAEPRVLADQSASVPPIHAILSRRGNLLLLFVASLGTTFSHVVVKWLPWSRDIPLGSSMFALPRTSQPVRNFGAL